jgi:hypothetical protein
LRRVSETTATTETAKAAEATEATDTARKEETGGSTTELAEPAHNRLLLIKGDLALVQRVLKGLLLLVRSEFRGLQGVLESGGLLLVEKLILRTAASQRRGTFVVGESAGKAINGWRVSSLPGDSGHNDSDWLKRAAAAKAGIYGNALISATIHCF